MSCSVETDCSGTMSCSVETDCSGTMSCSVETETAVVPCHVLLRLTVAWAFSQICRL